METGRSSPAGPLQGCLLKEQWRLFPSRGRLLNSCAEGSGRARRKWRTGSDCSGGAQELQTLARNVVHVDRGCLMAREEEGSGNAACDQSIMETSCSSEPRDCAI